MRVEMTDVLVMSAAGIIVLTWLISELSYIFHNHSNNNSNDYDYLD